MAAVRLSHDSENILLDGQNVESSLQAISSTIETKSIGEAASLISLFAAQEPRVGKRDSSGRIHAGS